MSKCGSSSFVQRGAAMEIITAVFLCLLVVGLCTAEHGQLNDVEHPSTTVFSDDSTVHPSTTVFSDDRTVHPSTTVFSDDSKVHPSTTPGEKESQSRQSNWATWQSCEHGNVKKIVGGWNAKRGEYPWQVAILADSSWYCGGSIINANWVLTAAHCVYQKDSFRLVFGSILFTGYEPGSVRQVTNKGVLHKHYNDDATLNDIALLRTARSLTFTDTISPVDLPGHALSKRNFWGEVATVCGWGITSDWYQEASACLMCTTNSIVEEYVCRSRFSRVTAHQHICLDASHGSGSCGGDSGGPLIWEDEYGNSFQIGIVSFGSQNCEDGTPGVYVRVAHYLTWIKAKTGIAIAP